MRRLTLLALVVIASATAACSDRSASRSPTMPQSPRLDGNDTTCRGGPLQGGGGRC